jgi:hypothetical protein
MKAFFALCALTLSTASFAHQYIQCASLDVNSWDRAVINLDGPKSTLFMTTGVHDPNELRILKPISLLSVVGDKTIYQAKDQYSVETITLPTAIIGQYSSDFLVTIDFDAVSGNVQMSQEMSCYSAIYE